MIGITSCGGYIPRLRLNRKAVVAANSWFLPALAAQGKGERAMCNWDEDCITMAVDAARDCLNGGDRDAIDAVYMASTTMPFADRQNSGVIAAALNLREGISTMDVTSSQRAGTTALLAGLNAVKGGAAKNVLVTATDKRKTRAASVQELQFGDGAAALMVGDKGVIAEFKGSHSVAIDFVDHYRDSEHGFDYTWEERWIRDEGYGKIVPKAVQGLFEATGTGPGDIDHFIISSVFRAVPRAVAKATGIDQEKLRDTLAGVCGETGTAHPLVMLVHALQEAKPGDKILVVGFGQGCDALLFEATDAVKNLNGIAGITGSLARRKEETNYMKFLTFNGLIEMEKGIRAESNPQTALTTPYRNRKMLEGLVGGICTECKTPQFPKADFCVNPDCGAIDTQEDYEFADQPAKVNSWSADWLVFTIDPPGHYGMVEFADGGRFMADFTDYDVGDVDVGMRMRMVFRVKGHDAERGFTRYFWKAAPAAPATEG
ncbi:MAG: hydroxymethylglutaryl-CoA synthase family protein [Alphaproteobacteria bacterium]